MTRLLPEIEEDIKRGELEEALNKHKALGKFLSTESIQDYFEISKKLIESLSSKAKLKEAFKIGEEASEILEKYDKNSAAKILIIIAQLEVRSGAYDKAEKHCKKAFELLKDTSNSIDIGKAHYFYGLVKLFSGNLKESESHFFDSITYFKRANKLEDVARVLNLLAQLYFIKGDWTQSKDKLGDAIEYTKKSNNTLLTHMYSLNLGMLYVFMGEWKRAESIFNKYSNKIQSIFKNPDVFCRELLRYSYFQILKRKWDKAIDLLKKAREIAEHNGLIYELGIAYEYLGWIALRRGTYEKAKEYFEKAYKIAKKNIP